MIVVIPARIGSSRLPGKPLEMIGDKPVIQHVWDRARSIILANEIVVSTDSLAVVDEVKSFGGEVVVTGDCYTGTDRVALTIQQHFPDFHGNDIVINLQGDLPFVDSYVVDCLAESLLGKENFAMSTPVNRKQAIDRLWESPDTVKALKGPGNEGVYFSRSPIPHGIDKLGYWFHHYGIYAFRNRHLQLFYHTGQTPWELCEGLEQLRAIESGMKVQLLETYCEPGIEINTPEDLAQARAWYESEGSKR